MCLLPDFCSAPFCRSKDRLTEWSLIVCLTPAIPFESISSWSVLGGPDSALICWRLHPAQPGQTDSPSEAWLQPAPSSAVPGPWSRGISSGTRTVRSQVEMSRDGSCGFSLGVSRIQTATGARPGLSTSWRYHRLVRLLWGGRWWVCSSAHVCRTTFSGGRSEYNFEVCLKQLTSSLTGVLLCQWVKGTWV